jgi:regulator of protease activity HflC (stomatin/prohibitin superfamily)
MEGGAIVIIFIVLFGLILAASTIKIVNQASVKIIERLGKFHKTAESGLNIIVPFIDKVRATIDLREQIIDILPQDVITRDNVTMQVNCVFYFQITDPVKSVYEISNLRWGLEQLTQSSLRAVMGELDLDHSLSGREFINTKLRSSLDVATDKWGVKVMRVEVKDITPPEDIRITMEKQMTAERSRRAIILTAEGEKQSAILRAEGQKQSAIVSAEGQKESAILQAEGIATARIKVAEAEKEAIQRIAAALEHKNTDPAQYLIAVRYLESLKDISNNSNKLVFMPYESSGILSSLGGIKELLNNIEK